MMSLHAPNLDDRRFQDLVDDAKRMIPHYSPEWSDHNVSDPGVTLIETFAFMMDELFYRLNRVPDNLYVSFLDLIGVTLFPPAAATVDLLLWLSAPQPDAVVIPQGTEASTRRTSDEQSIVFATQRALSIPPRALQQLATQATGGDPVAHADALRGKASVAVFSPKPKPGDVLLLGLDGPAPSCAVALRFDCQVQGVGVDPRNPPIVWEAWDGSGWVSCEVVKDETGGLNQPGDVVVLVPNSHTASVMGGARAGWLRCRAVEPIEGFPGYSASPVLRSVSAFTIGGFVAATHSETISDEVLGLSEGVPGQTFTLDRAPVVTSEVPFVVEVASGPGWDEWTEVDSFAGAGPEAHVVVVDRSIGQVFFPPAVREADGSLRSFGAVPPKGSPLRVRSYAVGGGVQGNVAARAISVLRTTLPFVLGVENRRAAHGGVAGETIEQAKVRGPLALRTRDRAVTVEDYEQLARRAAPSVARVKCIPAMSESEAGGVRLLVVPDAPADESGRLRFEDLIPPEDMLRGIATELDARRPIGARVLIEPPFYRGMTVVARLTAKPRVDVDLLQADALRALYNYFDPISGGQDGAGWPFGRAVNSGDVYAVLQGMPGTEIVDDVLLFTANPISRTRGEAVQKIDLEPSALVFSFEHQVRVKAGA
jgi:predicted phage baseplate assembly protein